jgi:glycosyltransferase involved in cell wall biosynthesis
MKTVNVVIPAYNEEKNIKRCIDSVLSQELTDSDLFITVVDDCSSDRTGEIVQSFEKENVFLISNKKNLGRASSINKGAFSRDSDFLYFVDGDCYFKDKRCIENMLQVQKKYNSDICIGEVSAVGKSFWDKYYNYCRNMKNEEEKWSSQNLLIRKQAFIQAGGFDEIYKDYGFEDRDLIYFCQKKGATIIFVPVSVVNTFCSFSIEQVCKKMYLSGKSSACIFWQKYPQIYEKSSYFIVHYRKRKIDKCFVFIMKHKKVLHFCLKLKMPFIFKQKIAKLILGIYFFEGTYENYNNNNLL